MHNNYYLSMALFLSVFNILFLAYITWKRRKMPRAFKLSVIMLATFFYTFGYAHEVSMTGIAGIKICLMIEYLGIPFIPALWLIFILDYTGSRFKSKYVYVLILIIPVLTLIVHYTNDLHHLFYKKIEFVYGRYFTMVYLWKGPWYWVHIVNSYFTIAACIVKLFMKYLKEGNLYRKQIVILVMGCGIPWILNILFLINNRKPFPDLTPFGFVISSALITWGIYRFHLLWFVPAAYEKIIQSMSEGVIVLDYQGQVVQFNMPAGIIIPELKMISMEKDNCEMVFKNYPVISEMLKHDLAVETRFRIHKYGKPGVYKLKLSLIQNKNYILGKILILTDITENENNVKNLTSASAQLTALNTLKDRLINIVSSDIKEPLVMLIDLSELLKGSGYDRCNNQLLVNELYKNIHNIYLRVDNMLECFQNKQTNNIYSPMEWKLSLLVEEAVQTIAGKAERKNISVIRDISESLVVFSDKGMFDIVLRNLLSNAVKFTYRNGSITLTAQKENNFVIISVKDTGVGMEEERIQMLFQDVECIPAAGTEGETGIGLGLLLSRMIIKRNYGDIWVDSTIGEGSNFFVSIPADGEWFR